MDLKEKKDVLGLISVGFFIMLVGVIIVITPNWYNATRDFIEDFKLEKIDGNVFLPAPAHPADHKVVYTAVEQFCLIWGLFQIAILVSKFFLRETVHKKAETFSGIIFWLSAAYVISLLLAESIGWFAFWAWILILVGITLVVRSLIVLLYELTR